MIRKLALSVSLLTVAACTQPPPPHWAQGGAVLALGRAHWERADNDAVDIDERGQVFEGGELQFVIDGTGRITDEDREPVAILLPAGELVGSADQYLGRIGIANAAPPDSKHAWVAVMPDGTVTRFDLDGERNADGRWQGCAGATQRTCTLVTHLMLLRRYHAATPHISVGLGVMVPF